MSPRNLSDAQGWGTLWGNGREETPGPVKLFACPAESSGVPAVVSWWFLMM